MTDTPAGLPVRAPLVDRVVHSRAVRIGVACAVAVGFGAATYRFGVAFPNVAEALGVTYLGVEGAALAVVGVIGLGKSRAKSAHATAETPRRAWVKPVAVAAAVVAGAAAMLVPWLVFPAFARAVGAYYVPVVTGTLGALAVDPVARVVGAITGRRRERNRTTEAAPTQQVEGPAPVATPTRASLGGSALV